MELLGSSNIKRVPNFIEDYLNLSCVNNVINKDDFCEIREGNQEDLELYFRLMNTYLDSMLRSNQPKIGEIITYKCPEFDKFEFIKLQDYIPNLEQEK
ncbi:hypothetical protein J4440_02405 [Candidatus Woesearchaeota archaeon]|nr:hypothetical protein [Candidatus Woesearchaeota archaeon]